MQLASRLPHKSVPRRKTLNAVSSGLVRTQPFHSALVILNLESARVRQLLAVLLDNWFQLVIAATHRGPARRLSLRAWTG